jgi:hypothetical protein
MQNEKAIKLLFSHPEQIEWQYLSSNPKAMQLIFMCPDKVDHSALSGNPNPLAMILLSVNGQIEGQKLCRNPYAIELITENLHKFQWWQIPFLSMNPAAAHLLAAHPDKIDWSCLCQPIAWMENVLQ